MRTPYGNDVMCIRSIITNTHCCFYMPSSWDIDKIVRFCIVWPFVLPHYVDCTIVITDVDNFLHCENKSTLFTPCSESRNPFQPFTQPTFDLCNKGLKSLLDRKLLSQRFLSRYICREKFKPSSIPTQWVGPCSMVNPVPMLLLTIPQWESKLTDLPWIQANIK